ncbi:unnamed protein product [Adineta steineri]|uniref:Uncharacterized protein n=3 Tax=Adineta steineri TaxID=433720 RepID=A0A814WW24_9BILA|nr:unnamed protein product [Adineta steineri]
MDKGSLQKQIESLRYQLRVEKVPLSKTLQDDDEHDLKQILMDMKNEIGNGETNLCILGKVLRGMGHLDLAKKYYYRCLDGLSQNDPLLLTVYKDLAKIAAQQKDYEEHLRLRRILAKIKEEIQLNDNEIETSEIDKLNNNGNTNINEKIQLNDNEIQISEINKLTYNDTIQKRKSKNYMRCNWYLKSLICSFILILMIGIGIFTLKYTMTKNSSKSSEESKSTIASITSSLPPLPRTKTAETTITTTSTSPLPLPATTAITITLLSTTTTTKTTPSPTTTETTTTPPPTITTTTKTTTAPPSTTTILRVWE